MPTPKYKLSKYEQDILTAFEKGEYRVVENRKEELKKYQQAADLTLRKLKRINIRISINDLLGLQKIALEEGLPYQTLISSVLHKFCAGRLK
jgi:predicted DNA binding CopG/RHH family protein